MRRSWIEGTLTGAASSSGTPGFTWQNTTYNGDTANTWGTVGAGSTTADNFGVNLWSAVAGNFSPAGSKSFALNTAGVSAVQGWITTPATNFGVTIQNYATSATEYDVQFSTNNNTTVANRPQLTVNYCVPNPSPTISTTGTLTPFNAAVGQTSAEQSFTVSGTNMTDAITVTAPADFQVSLTSGSGFASSVTTAAPTSGTITSTTIYVHLVPTSTTTYGANITNASTGATTQNVAVTGSSVPTITVTGSLTPFSSQPGMASTAQSYTVSGSNLTADIVITAPTDFQISTDNVTFDSSLTLTQTGGIVGSMTIYARMNRATEGTPSGNISHTSTDATTRNVAVSGTVLYVYTLTAGNDGHGSVTLSPAGGSYNNGTTVTLTPVPDTGYEFHDWSGDNSLEIINTAGIYTIVVNGNKTVYANFSAIPQYTLTTAVTPCGWRLHHAQPGRRHLLPGYGGDRNRCRRFRL